MTQNPVQCLVGSLGLQALLCRVNIVPTGGITFKVSALDSLSCVCSAANQAAVVNAFNTCVTNAPQLGAAFGVICPAVVSNPTCQATVNPLGDLLVKTTAALGPQLDQIGAAGAILCGQDKPLLDLATTCTGWSLDKVWGVLSPICPGYPSPVTTTTTTVAVIPTTTTTTVPAKQTSSAAVATTTTTSAAAPGTTTSAAAPAASTTSSLAGATTTTISAGASAAVSAITTVASATNSVVVSANNGTTTVAASATGKAVTSDVPASSASAAAISGAAASSAGPASNGVAPCSSAAAPVVPTTYVAPPASATYAAPPAKKIPGNLYTGSASAGALSAVLTAFVGLML